MPRTPVSAHMVEQKEPCHDCEHKQLCAKERKACSRFAIYVVDNQIYEELPRSPTFTMYYRLMVENDYTLIRRETHKFLSSKGVDVYKSSHL